MSARQIARLRALIEEKKREAEEDRRSDSDDGGAITLIAHLLIR